MQIFNLHLITNGTSWGGFTAGGFYPLISLLTRMKDDEIEQRGTATLFDNIWTNNVESRVASELVTVRISDHLPVFAFAGGAREVDDRSVNEQAGAGW